MNPDREPPAARERGEAGFQPTNAVRSPWCLAREIAAIPDEAGAHRWSRCDGPALEAPRMRPEAPTPPCTAPIAIAVAVGERMVQRSSSATRRTHGSDLAAAVASLPGLGSPASGRPRRPP
jgi:hypothetical protein